MNISNMAYGIGKDNSAKLHQQSSIVENKLALKLNSEFSSGKIVK